MSDDALPSQASADERHLAERTIRSQPAFNGRFLQVWADDAALADGTPVHREYIRHPGAVMVVPLLDDGRFLMERQFRYPLQRVLLEFPAGKIDPGEAPLTTAQRELREETGFRAGQWALAGRLHNAAAYSDEFIEIWFARGLERGPRQLDPGELIDLVALDLSTLREQAAAGELTDAKTLIGLLWLEHLEAGRWKPDWTAGPTATVG